MEHLRGQHRYRTHFDRGYLSMVIPENTNGDPRPRCSGCRFYVASLGPFPVGNCHAQPPTVVMGAALDAGGKPDADFVRPGVSAADVACGLWLLFPTFAELDGPDPYGQLA